MTWLGRLLRRRKQERDLQAELADHFERQVADNLRAGMTADEARRAARLKFGGAEKITEDCRDARGTAWLESTLQDFRFALRTLCKSPGFTLAAVLMLALGIGANAAIFELLDAVLLRMLPVKDPAALMQVEVRGGNHGLGINSGDETNLTYPLWLQIRDHQQAFSGIFAWSTRGFDLGKGMQESNATGMWVSGRFFETLGLNPVRGRLFRQEDDRPGCGLPGAVISYAFWQSRFGGQDSAIGKSIVVDDVPVQVIGVAPANFTGLEVGTKFDFALPICSLAAYNPGEPMLGRTDYFWLRVIGRLKPGWTASKASAELDSLSPGMLEATLPTGYASHVVDEYRRYRLNAVPAGTGVSDLRSTYDTGLWLLLGITGLVLLIACANLSSLILARASARAREMAVRLALGASRWRLIRQLLAEGLLLGAAGAMGGAGIAGVLSRGLVRSMNNHGDDVGLDLYLDGRIVAFIAGAALLTCIVFALAPAFRSSRISPGETLKSGARGTTGGHARFSFQRILVVSQIATSLVLLVGAGLFVRSFRNILKVNPGFREKNLYAVYLSFDKLKMPVARLDEYSRDLVNEIRLIPQVESAATTTHLPFAGSWTSGIRINDREGSTKFTWASPGYFQTLGIPVISGRDFAESDTRNSPHVTVVSESFLREFLPNENPVGKVIRTAPEPNFPATTYEIVGVVKNTKYQNLRESVTPPEAYAPYDQYPNPAPWLAVLIYSPAPASVLIPAVRAKMEARNADISVEYDVIEQEIRDSLVGERMMAILTGFFGALAVLLSTIGLYGVISYFVALRRNEIGIRIALGANPAKIMALILRQTMTMLAIGVGIGLALSLAAARSASSLIFGLKATDPLTVAGSAAILVIVAVIASYVPAHRASHIEPMLALRHD
ncbi:MAG TPA: ABC transporter permease [Candidatus Acidoferrales bacterium]|nr:ABC transporter permease [Candidatus Acidoferrales bacterium]